MKSKGTAGLYVLLVVFATISMAYYVAGVLALRQEFFYGSRYAEVHFDFEDDGQTITNVAEEAKSAGLVNGDFLLALNGVPFYGEAQLHNILQGTKPGDMLTIQARSPSGSVRELAVRLSAREGPDWSFSGYVAFLGPILGVPLLGLLVGYWVVAARPRDLNAWLVLLLLAFPEVSFGNLDWSFWPEPWYVLLGLWHWLIQNLEFAALLWFGFLFPERWRMDRRLPWFKYLILAATCCTSILELGFLVGQHFQYKLSATWPLCNA